MVVAGGLCHNNACLDDRYRRRRSRSSSYRGCFGREETDDRPGARNVALNRSDFPPICGIVQQGFLNFMRISDSVRAVVQDGEFVRQIRVILRNGELITRCISYCSPGEGDVDRYVCRTIFRVLRCHFISWSRNNRYGAGKCKY